jgi:predicted RNA-binding Zn-ribbon protein involved in translation (DUF1610 family)
MTEAQQNPGCLAAILRIFGRQPKTSSYTVTDVPADEAVEHSPYRTRDDFLSPAEHSFYLVLKGRIGDTLTICPKVSLADIFFVIRPDENLSAYNRINRKHVDFLICDPITMRPQFAIELDDSSHGRPDRVERDEFVDKIFENACLPLIRIPTQAGYSSDDINAILEKAFRANPTTDGSTQEQMDSHPADQAPYCPKCGTRMVLRVARSGSQAGKKFYGCPNFPKCRSIVPCQN